MGMGQTIQMRRASDRGFRQWDPLEQDSESIWQRSHTKNILDTGFREPLTEESYKEDPWHMIQRASDRSHTRNILDTGFRQHLTGVIQGTSLTQDSENIQDSDNKIQTSPWYKIQSTKDSYDRNTYPQVHINSAPDTRFGWGHENQTLCKQST